MIVSQILIFTINISYILLDLIKFHNIVFTTDYYSIFYR